MKNVTGAIQRPQNQGVQIQIMRKEQERIDRFGNIIDPETKQIIKKNKDKD
jgi:hypothetical protein